MIIFPLVTLTVSALLLGSLTQEARISEPTWSQAATEQNQRLSRWAAAVMVVSLVVAIGMGW